MAPFVGKDAQGWLAFGIKPGQSLEGRFGHGAVRRRGRGRFGPKRCKVSREAPTVFRITLVQGLNRQIRRMCEHFGYAVTKLERNRIMNVRLQGLPPGDWRDLTEEELSELLRAVEHSSSEPVATPGKSSKRKVRQGPRWTPQPPGKRGFGKPKKHRTRGR